MSRKHRVSQTRWIQRGPLEDIIIKMPKVKDKEMGVGVGRMGER